MFTDGVDDRAYGKVGCNCSKDSLEEKGPVLNIRARPTGKDD
jgi:hypothetical protein